MAVVMLSTALGCAISAVRPAAAQDGNTASAIRIDIAAEPLDAAIRSLIQQTGLQIAYPASLSQNTHSSAVSGTYTPSEALSRMLAGTGLTYRFTGANTVTLEAAPGAADGALTLPPLQVEGQPGVPSQAVVGNLSPAYAGGQVATGGQLGLLGNRSIMDTPFSQTSYTGKTLQDQQVRNVTDVLSNEPSVRATWNDMSYTAAPYIRGFAVSPWDFSLNGLFGVVPGLAFSADSIERVEVLHGPSALLNGMPPLGSVGGAINLVPKRAEVEPITRLTATYASSSQYGAQIDVGRRFGENHEWGIRFNGTYRDGDSGTDHQSQELGDAVLGADYRGDHLRISLDVGYQNQDIQSPLRPTYLATGVAVPKAPSANGNYFQPWTYAHSRDWFGALRAEYDLSDDWTIYGAVGGRQDRSY
ncbi:MAG TPA: TonB-dependent receptor, partial [Rhodopila sp.]